MPKVINPPLSVAPATLKRKSPVQNLKLKVASFETRLDAKDKEIQEKDLLIGEQYMRILSVQENLNKSEQDLSLLKEKIKAAIGQPSSKADKKALLRIINKVLNVCEN